MSKEDCMKVRQTIDDQSSCTHEQLLSAEQHFRSCQSCETWRNQINVISDVAAKLPAFDVPEALTQRIMSDVQESVVNKAWTLRTIVLTCVVIAAVASMFSFESFDTINGACAWLIGVVFLFGLKQMIQTSEAAEQQLHRGT